MAYYGYILRLLNAPVKRYYFGVCGEANPLEAGSQLIQAVREKKGWVPSELCRLFSLENLSDTIAYSWTAEMTGTQWITVTASNIAGSAAHTQLVIIDPIEVYLPLVMNSAGP